MLITKERAHRKGQSVRKPKLLNVAGRFDINSTGLLVLTEDGRIARQLIQDGGKVDKEYIVRVEGRLDAEVMKRLEYGLELDGRKLLPAEVCVIRPDRFKITLRQGGRGKFVECVSL